MCGIVGYVGAKNALNILIDGLSALEYRGYDSAGIAIIKNNQVQIIKEEGKLQNLIDKIDFSEFSKVGIGHTRWATHGKPSKENSHPHQKNVVTLVHNGIIENYEELKANLKEYTYESQTDTEVLAALIDKLYQECKDKKLVLKKAKEMVKGSYALGIIFADEADSIYALRKDSPLILASSKDGNFIASDVPAILKYTNQYMLLEDSEMAIVKEDKIEVYNKALDKINKQILTFEGNYEAACKGGFDHFMLKEIYEQPEVFKNTVSSYTEYGIDSLIEKMPNFSKYNKIEIVACGSAYHAGLVGKSLIEEYANIPVNVEIASEYRYKKNFNDENTLVIFVSQSGETADTLACLRKVKEKGIDTLGLINVVGSSIARECKNVIYIKAGCEIAVATTKAYSAQVALLSLIALNLGHSELKSEEIINILTDIKKLPKLIEETINSNNYLEIAQKLHDKKDIFFLGRNIDYALALEGSLKLKEISYIHSEAYASGELKHGTISLIDPNTPVIAISTDENLAEKTISNIKEVKARGAEVYYITTNALDKTSDFYDQKIVIPTVHKLLQPLLTILPLQLISYHVANLRDCNIDKPKNLAKSVTVE